MNKLKKIIFLVIVLFIASINYANADSIKLKGDSEIKGEEFTLVLEISSAKDVAGAQIPITWDDSKLEIVSSFDKNVDAKHKSLSIYNFTFPAKSGATMLLDAAKTKTGTIDVAEIYITAKEDFKEGETTTITLGESTFAGLSNNSWKVSGSAFKIKKVSSEQPKVEKEEDNKKEDNIIVEKPTEEPKKEETSKENNKYSCQKVKDVYYDKKGNVVTKIQYEKDCLPPNPDSGYKAPFIGLLIVMGVIFFLKRKPINNI